MINYFNIEPSRVSIVVTTGKGEYRKEEEKLLPANLPTLERFASTLDVYVDTMVDWATMKNKDGTYKHPEFHRAYVKCKQLQKDILVANGLAGLYQSNFAIFVAKNFTDMEDKTKVDNTTNGKDLPTPIIQINVPSNNSDEKN